MLVLRRAWGGRGGVSASACRVTARPPAWQDAQWSGSWSGDCRGLQNRLRGDALVLGGFDSHVAPPLPFAGKTRLPLSRSGSMQGCISTASRSHPEPLLRVAAGDEASPTSATRRGASNGGLPGAAEGCSRQRRQPSIRAGGWVSKTVERSDPFRGVESPPFRHLQELFSATTSQRKPLEAGSTRHLRAKSAGDEGRRRRPSDSAGRRQLSGRASPGLMRRCFERRRSRNREDVMPPCGKDSCR